MCKPCVKTAHYKPIIRCRNRHEVVISTWKMGMKFVLFTALNFFPFSVVKLCYLNPSDTPVIRILTV